MAREHTMPVLDELSELLPEGGLRRGSTLAVDGPGATTLAVSLGVQVSTSGAWVAAVGIPDLGLSVVTELGACLERWALIDDHWHSGRLVQAQDGGKQAHQFVHLHHGGQGRRWKNRNGTHLDH